MGAGLGIEITTITGTTRQDTSAQGMRVARRVVQELAQPITRAYHRRNISAEIGIPDQYAVRVDPALDICIVALLGQCI